MLPEFLADSQNLNIHGPCSHRIILAFYGIYNLIAGEHPSGVLRQKAEYGELRCRQVYGAACYKGFMPGSINDNIMNRNSAVINVLPAAACRNRLNAAAQP